MSSTDDNQPRYSNNSHKEKKYIYDNTKPISNVIVYLSRCVESRITDDEPSI